mgnify:CR=1 FL=1
MRLQRNKQSGVKIAIQPYPYIKEESRGKNKSLVILDTDTEEVRSFMYKCFQANNEFPDKMAKLLEFVESKIGQSKIDQSNVDQSKAS